MNKQMQIRMMKSKIKKMNVSPDLIDLEAYVDSTLNFNENWNNIRPRVNKLRQQIKKELGGRLSSWEMTDKAITHDNNRSSRSRYMDDKKRAKSTFYPDDLTKKQYKKWTKKPNRHDIEGVDTQGGW